MQHTAASILAASAQQIEVTAISSSAAHPVTDKYHSCCSESQITHCDSILEHMEGLLGKFQTDLGQVSEEIRTLQVRCLRLVAGLTAAYGTIWQTTAGLSVLETALPVYLPKGCGLLVQDVAYRRGSKLRC